GLIAGAVGGAVTGGLGSAATVLRSGATAAQAAGAASRSLSLAGRATSVARTTVGGAITGASGSATSELATQVIRGGDIDLKRIGQSALTGAVVGGALSAGSRVRLLDTLGARTVGRLDLAGKDVGIKLAGRAFREGTVGIEAARSHAAIGRELN